MNYKGKTIRSFMKPKLRFVMGYWRVMPTTSVWRHMNNAERKALTAARAFAHDLNKRH